jgi:glycosyltransferase involved in cell wall biosynthesis
VHQFVPMLHRGDAVGQHTLGVQAELSSRGIDSAIYVELDDPETAAVTRPARSYPDQARPGDVLVYQFATASDLAGWLGARPEPLVVNYHNVTPAPLFAPWDNELARHQVRAHVELTRLAGRSTLGVAVSEMNRCDLVDVGFAATAVVPPVLPVVPGGGGAIPGADPDHNADAGTPPPRGGGRWLAVGRLAPNKAIEDVIAGLLAHRALYDAGAELRVVGKAAVPAYSTALRRYSADLGLAGAVDFAGRVDDEALVSAYRSADVLVVTSEHEGFCLPAVEAMIHGLPVVAYRQGAVPETLGGAGVLIDAKDPVSIAEAVHRLGSDHRFRADVVTAGFERLPALGLATAGARLADLLVAVRDRSGWPEGSGVEMTPTAPDSPVDGAGTGPVPAEPRPQPG